MWSRLSRFRDVGVIAAFAALLAAGSLARADVIDPTIPRALPIGAPRGAAPSDRLDAARTGRARTKLPHPPIEQWRRNITRGIELLPVVDGDDNILIAVTTPVPEVLKLGPDGKEVWRARIGGAPPQGAPVLTSDGTLVVITNNGQAWGIAPNGGIRFTTPLGVRGRDIEVAPLALGDGGLLVASGGTLIELDRDGAVRARASLEVKSGSMDSRITGALLSAPSGDPRLKGATLFTTESGSVYSFRPPSAPHKLGSIGGYPRRGAVLADDRTLIAVVDNRRIVAFDLPTGTPHVRGSAPPLSLFDSPVAIASHGLVLVALQTGLLVGLDAAGNEKIRVALEKPPPMPDPNAPAAGGVVGGVPGGAAGTMSFFGPVDLKPSPPVIVDADGRVGFARANGRVGVVGPTGNVALAGERVCAAPLGVVPAGERRMLLACHDGGLWLYGE